LSGEYVNVLKRRALSFLEEASKVKDPDLAAFLAEQSIQLYIKAVLYELFGERVRGHNIRELLGLLARLLDRAEYHNEANRVRDFVADNRGILIDVEEAYIMSRYGERGYTLEEAKKFIDLAKRLINLLEEVAKDVKLG
jgi:HEPN domain-containing protein